MDHCGGAAGALGPVLGANQSNQGMWKTQATSLRRRKREASHRHTDSENRFSGRTAQGYGQDRFGEEWEEFGKVAFGGRSWVVRFLDNSG